MSKSRLTILIIEDNDIFFDLLQSMLEEHDCFLAQKKDQAIDLFNSLNPDIVFIDVSLPERDGFDILKSIQEIQPSIFAVMLTSSNLERDMKEAQSLGIKAYIKKPFKYEDIHAVIEDYYNKPMA